MRPVCRNRPWDFRAFDAVHLPDYRTDPRPAAACGLACNHAAGADVADGVAAALSQPARRPRYHDRLRPGVSGRHRHGPAAGVLARRHRLSRRRQPHVRRLSVGAAVWRRDALDGLSAVALLRRRPAGGARGAAHHDDISFWRAEPRIRPGGGGAATVGAVAAALLAIDRPEPAQCLVWLVDRGRPAAADDVGSADTVVAACGF